MIKLKKWIFLALVLVAFYYIFIVNILVTLSIILSLYIAFKLYKYYLKTKLIKTANSKESFKKSELGLFVALVAKVAKADGVVQELEAQLIKIMFDDISKIFPDKEKVKNILKDIFNEEKEINNNTKEIAKSLNELLGRNKFKKKQFAGFLIQLAFINKGIDPEEDKVLREIMHELDISQDEYNSITAKFEDMLKNKKQTMSFEEACKILEVNLDDDISIIKKRYRKLIRQYHPDIMKSQDKDEAYIEEATAKTQEINQAYEVIKKAKK